MTVQRMDHVGVVVDDLDAATEFFAALGLEAQGTASLGGPAVDRIIGLEGVRSDVAFVRTPDGHSQLELIKFHSPSHPPDDHPAPSNAPGIRHLTFAVDDLDAVLGRLKLLGATLVGDVERYGDTYRLCYLRGPAGIILELAERVG